MRKRLPPVFVALALAALLPACGDSTARTLGLVRDAPDEFQVTTRAPLSMPPNMTHPAEPEPRLAAPAGTVGQPAGRGAAVAEPRPAGPAPRPWRGPPAWARPR
jgi:uncharacterized lipoprotein